MQRIAKTPFLANLYVCDQRYIVKEITIIGRRLSPLEAQRKALAKMESFRKRHGRYTSLHQLRGLYDEGKAYSSPITSIDARRTSAHERFHTKVAAAGLDKKTTYPPLEESAAYAYETMVGPDYDALGKADRERYARLARNSVRFLFALDRRGHEEMLVESMAGVCGNAMRVIAGDDIAIAIESAPDCMFYLECVAVLKRWGLHEGEKILLDAVGVSDEKGANAGRRYLLERLTPKTRERINASYGINLDGFRFRSLRLPNAEDDTWEW